MEIKGQDRFISKNKQSLKLYNPKADDTCYDAAKGADYHIFGVVKVKGLAEVSQGKAGDHQQHAEHGSGIQKGHDDDPCAEHMTAGEGMTAAAICRGRLDTGIRFIGPRCIASMAVNRQHYKGNAAGQHRAEEAAVSSERHPQQQRGKGGIKDPSAYMIEQKHVFFIHKRLTKWGYPIIAQDGRESKSGKILIFDIYNYDFIVYNRSRNYDFIVYHKAGTV